MGRSSGPLSSSLFFFSSRRRHTRFDCDWSSDVCSSDLADINARSDLRVATYPTVTGEKIVLRLFHGTAIRTLSELDFPADRKSTRLNSSHSQISYAVFCLKKKIQIDMSHNTFKSISVSQ